MQYTEALGDDNRVSALGHGRYAIKSVWRPKEITEDGTVESITPIIDKSSDIASRYASSDYPSNFALGDSEEERLMKELPVAANFSGAPQRLKTKNKLLVYLIIKNLIKNFNIS